MLLLCSFGLLIACCLFSVYRNESPFLLLNPHHPEMTLSLCPRDCFISALCSSMKCVSWPCSPLFKLEGQQRVVTSPSFCVVVSMMMMIMKSGESSQHNLVKTRSLPLRVERTTSFNIVIYVNQEVFFRSLAPETSWSVFGEEAYKKELPWTHVQESDRKESLTLITGQCVLFTDMTHRSQSQTRLVLNIQVTKVTEDEQRKARDTESSSSSIEAEQTHVFRQRKSDSTDKRIGVPPPIPVKTSNKLQTTELSWLLEVPKRQWIELLLLLPISEFHAVVSRNYRFSSPQNESEGVTQTFERE